MRKLVLLVTLALPFATVATQAQSTAAAHSSMASAADSTLSSFEKTFTGAAAAMPADKFDFTPASANIPGAKFADVRTFAGEVKHVAQANFGIFAAVAGSKPDYDMQQLKNAKSKDEILAALAASFAYGHKVLANLTDAQAQESMDFDGPKPRILIAVYPVTHGEDHYGQMVVYLRMNGIVPPASAK